MKIGILLYSVLALLSAGYASAADDHFFTTALPEPDRADLFIVPNSVFGSNPAAHLDAKGAHLLAALVRSQSFGQFGMRCNNPRYGMKFYLKGKLIACETVCFACHWINPVSSDMMKLEAYLKNALPLVLK